MNKNEKEWVTQTACRHEPLVPTCQGLGETGISNENSLPRPKIELTDVFMFMVDAKVLQIQSPSPNPKVKKHQNVLFYS